MADGPAADPGSQDLGGHGGHGERHDLLMAAMLDRDVTDDDRAVAEGLLGTCSACVTVHADLIAFAAATTALPAAARPRDFRLTAADAARLELAGVRDGEPRGAASRLTGEMHVPNPDHRRHDQLLIASLLDRSTGSADRERAEALVSACDECDALYRDLVSLRDATRALPTPPRRREFTLSTEDAQRLRRFGWRRLVAAFGSTRDAFSRPLAIGLTTLGLAGLLVATVPGVLPGGTGSPASAPTLGQAVGGGAGSESLGGSKEVPAASAAPSVPGPAAAALTAPSAAPTSAAAPVAPSTEPAPSGEAYDTFVGAPAASAGAAAIASGANASDQRDSAARTAATSIGEQAPSVDRLAVIILASLLLVVGVGLFALRWVGRRI